MSRYSHKAVLYKIHTSHTLVLALYVHTSTLSVYKAFIVTLVTTLEHSAVLRRVSRLQRPPPQRPIDATGNIHRRGPRVARRAARVLFRTDRSIVKYIPPASSMVMAHEGSREP